MRLVPLVEIISQAMNAGTASKRVQNEYRRLVENLGSELGALIHASYSELAQAGGEQLALAVLRARAGEVDVEPGYDGVYGSVRVFPTDNGPATAGPG